MPAPIDQLLTQLRDTLNQVQNNTFTATVVLEAIKGDTATLNVGLSSLTNTTTAGFQLLGQGIQFLGEGLYTMHELQREANAHLASQVSEIASALCVLVAVSDVLCKQLRTMEAVAKVQQSELAALRTLEGVEKLAHAREFVELEQVRELELKVAACCPVATPVPEPCYQDSGCTEPDIRRHQPRGEDWRPNFASRDVPR
jgi:hypothetical protein